MVVQYQRKMIPIRFNVARDNNGITYIVVDCKQKYT